MHSAAPHCIFLHKINGQISGSSVTHNSYRHAKYRVGFVYNIFALDGRRKAHTGSRVLLSWCKGMSWTSIFLAQVKQYIYFMSRYLRNIDCACNRSLNVTQYISFIFMNYLLNKMYCIGLWGAINKLIYVLRALLQMLLRRLLWSRNPSPYGRLYAIWTTTFVAQCAWKEHEDTERSDYLPRLVGKA